MKGTGLPINSDPQMHSAKIIEQSTCLSKYNYNCGRRLFGQ